MLHYTAKSLLIVMIIFLASTVNAQHYFNLHGNQIQYEEKGSGEPVVVIVGGYGVPLSSFDPVFDSISQFTTVVRYSRAGLGNSSYQQKNKEFDTIIDELELLIDSLGFKKPFVLIGHSYGGLMIRGYAKRHPASVAGLLFDDATFEDYFKRLTALKKNAESLELADHADVMKRFPVPAMHDEFTSLWKVWHSPEQWVKWFYPQPSVPTVVLTSMKIADSTLRSSTELMNARYLAHSVWLKGKPFSMQIGIENAGHFIHRDQPEIFIDAVHMLINVIRNNKKQ